MYEHVRMARSRWLIATALACLAAAPVVRKPLLGPPAPGVPDLPKPYVDAVKAGEAALDRGDLKTASAEFTRALAVDLPEVPNYEVVIRIAEIKCLERAPDARRELAEFACMLDVDEGKRPCFERTADGDIGERSPAVTHQCFDRMCGELYLPYYEHPDRAELAAIRELRGELKRVGKICRPPG